MIFHRQNFYDPRAFREGINGFEDRFQQWFGKDSLLVHIALSECFNNAWEHGNCKDGEKPVTVTLKEGKMRIYILIEDMGEGYCFDDAVLSADSDAFLEKERGRGLFIIQNTMDFAMTDRSGTKTMLIKRKITKSERA